jgi:hypothetical protein
MKLGNEQVDIGRVSIWHLVWAHEGPKRPQSIDRAARHQLPLDYDNDNDRCAALASADHDSSI